MHPQSNTQSSSNLQEQLGRGLKRHRNIKKEKKIPQQCYKDRRKPGALRRLLAPLPSTSGEEGHPWKHSPESCPHTQGTCKLPCHRGKAPIPRAACEQAQELKQEA